MEPIDALIDQLRSEGSIDSRGEFTLDRERAREKMQQFLLADPRRYVLELVQAAVLKGATTIRFQIDADDMRMEFDGEPFTTADFEHVYGSVFAKRGTRELRARQQLALGLNSAMALNPRFIRVVSGSQAQTARLELRPDEPDSYGAATEPHIGTAIHVKDRFRPGLVVSFFRNLGGTIPEELLIREFCGFARSSIDLEGEDVAQGLVLGSDAVAVVNIDQAGTKGACGFVPGSQRAAVIHVVVNGVWVTSHEVEELPAGLVVVVENPNLRKNVSQSDVVRDDVYKALRTAVSLAHTRAFEVLVDLHTDGNDAVSGPWMDDLVRREFERCRVLGMYRGADPIATQLSKLPRWHTITGARVTLSDCVGQIERHKQLLFANKTHEVLELPKSDFVLHIREKWERTVLKRLFANKLKNATRRLESEAKRRRQRERWRQDVREPVISDFVRAKVPIEGPGIVGELAALSSDRRPFSIDFIIEGARLCTIRLKLSSLQGLKAVIEGELRPNRDFTTILRDEAAVRAISAMRVAIGQLALELVANIPSAALAPSLFRDLYGRCMRYLGAALDRDLPGKLLKAFEFSAKGKKRYGKHKYWPAPIQRPELLQRIRGENEPIARVQLFPTTTLARATLGEIAAEIKQRGKVRVLSNTLEPRSMSDRLTLLLSDTERTALIRLFGAGAVENYDSAFHEENAARRHASKVAVAPMLAISTHARVAISGEDLEGELGIPTVADEDSKGQVVVRLLLDRRMIASIRFSSPLTPLMAIVSSGSFQPTSGYSGVVNDEKIEAAKHAIARAIPALIRELAAGEHTLDSTAPRAQRRFLIDAADLFSGKTPKEKHVEVAEIIRAAAAEATHETSLLDVIEGAIFFRRVGHHNEATLAEVRRALESGPVGVLDRTPHLGFEPKRLILVCERSDRKFLNRHLGPDATEDAGPWLEREAKRHRFESRPRFKSIGIQPSLVLVKHRFEEDGLIFEVGLAATHPGGKSQTSLVLCHERRMVTTLTQPGYRLLSIADDEHLVPTDDFTNFERDGRIEWLFERCENAVPELMLDLREKWTLIDPGLRRAAWHHILDFLADAGAGSHGREAALESDALRACADLAAFRGRQQSYSLLDLGRTFETFRCVVYAHQSASPMVRFSEETGHIDDEPVVVVSAHELAALVSIFPGGVMDEQSRFERNRRLAELPPLANGAELEGLARIAVEGEGLEGVLVFPRQTDAQPRVDFGIEGRLVQQLSISDTYPCVGVLSGDGLHVSPSWDTIVLEIGQRTLLEHHARELYGQAANEYEQAGPQLVHALLRLHRSIGTFASAQDSADGRLYQRLRELPLLASDSGLMSLADVLDRQPPELAHLGLWIEPPKPPPRPEPAPAPEPQPKAKTAEPKPVPARGRFDSSRSPLLAALESLLLSVGNRPMPPGAPNTHAWREIGNTRIHLGYPGGLDPVIKDRDTAVLNLAHDQVRIAVDTYDGNVATLGFLAAALYTAVRKPSDDNHLSFHLALVGEIASRLAAK